MEPEALLPAQLPERARRVLEEEEALLARVSAALVGKVARRARAESAAHARLTELRDEAATAAPHDLPTLFQEMSLARATAERPERACEPELSSPYFAHMILEEEGVRRDYCLGRATFIDLSREVRIVDWRDAPVAGLFYRYREGDAFEEQLPGRVAEGTVISRRIVVVGGGALSKIVLPEFTLTRADGERWRCLEPGGARQLAGGTGTAARPGALGVGAGATDLASKVEISAVLDREQYQALLASAERPLLVLGSAGSGKTTVALHRLAHLAFAEPERFTPDSMGVVVPEVGLARLAERLLAPHGLSRVAVRTLDRWASDLARTVFGKLQCHIVEDAPGLVVRFKRDAALFAELGEHLRQSPGREVAFDSLRIELYRLLCDAAFNLRVWARAGGTLPRSALEEVARHAKAQLDLPARSIPSGLLRGYETVDGRRIEEGTPSELAGSIDLEDLPLLLFMRARRGHPLRGERLSHLVLDEAEDISLVELELLGRGVGKRRSITIAGDDAQQTHASFAGWSAALGALGASDAALCRLQVTWRCPQPIAEAARRVLGHLAPSAPAQAGRDGVPVGYFTFPATAHATLFLVEALGELLEREPGASVGVIARSAEGARELFKALSELPRTRLVLDGEFTFSPGVDVTDLSNVKGLEFDYVILPELSASNWPVDDMSRRELHVGMTRACHQLWLIASGTPTRLITEWPPGERATDGR